MNSKEKLAKVFEHLINDESEKASELLKSYILETAAAIHQELVEEEDIMEMDRDIEHGDMGEDLADEIAAHKEEIESEEALGEEGEEVEELDEPHNEEELDLEDLANEIDELEDTVDHVVDVQDEFADKFAKLEAEFAKIIELEEPEHHVDIDGDGEIEGGEEVMESVELHDVKVDMKDKSGDHKSPVAPQKDRIVLGGKPVKTIGKHHDGYDREDMKPEGEVTKHSNVVKDGKEAIVKSPKVDNKDKAPHAGESPAMPK